MTTPRKETLYRTARIAVDGLDIPKGEFVNVRFAGTAFDAFLTQSEQPLFHVWQGAEPKFPDCYFASALTRFCL